MFSFTYDSNPFSTFPSSSYPTLPFYIDPENDFASNTLLHDPLVVPFIPTTHDIPFPEETVANLAVADCTAMLQQDANNGYGAHYGSIPNLLTQNQKPAIAKKDRHSKIHTSQGLRDRRVRLSSEIARKFFDLQDMLEFDKPSNTLEWLFTKSEDAIKELARSKHSCCSGGKKCSCDHQPHGVDSNEKSLAGSAAHDASKGRKLKWAQREDVCVQTKKESREKARARARERTCYKICNNTGRVQDLLEERCPATANTQILHQLRSSIQPDASARWPNQLVQTYPPHLLGSEAPRDGFNVIEESIMIKRNMKPSLMSSHHQNLVIPKEASFNNNDYHSFPYSTPNWDINGAINNAHPNFCGIATMNLSTCFMNQW